MHGVNSSERYCVFVCHTNWFALPATCIREVCPKPPLVAIPRAATVLAGICHLRNEFLPVVRLDDSASDVEVNQLLVLSGTQGNWAILARHVCALEALEMSHVTNFVQGDVWSAAVLGSAFYREHVVKILEPQRLYRCIEQSLNRGWEFESAPHGVALPASSIAI